MNTLRDAARAVLTAFDRDLHGAAEAFLGSRQHLIGRTIAQADALRDLRAALDAEPDGWVSVEERLPPEACGTIWGYHADCGVDIAYRGAGSVLEMDGAINDRPTHWMPYHIPPPPETAP